MGKGGKDKSCRNQVGMDAGAAAGAGLPKEPVRVTRHEDGSITVTYAHQQIEVVGDWDLPSQDMEPHVGADGQLYESAPLLLMRVDSGTVIDAEGARPLMPGTYLVSAKGFERMESAATLEVADGLDEAGNPVMSEPEPAKPEAPLPRWEDMPRLEAQALQRLCFIVQRHEDGMGALTVSVEFEVMMANGGYNHLSEEEQAKAAQDIRAALESLREQDLVRTPYDENEWDLTERGWAVLEAA